MSRASNIRPNPTAENRSMPIMVPLGVLAGKPVIPLNRPVTTVGARENCRLHLVSRTVSQTHAILVNSGGGTYICDLASREGVLVNDVAVKHEQLKTGDRVQIGKFLFEYRGAKDAPTTIDVDPAPATLQISGGDVVDVDEKTLLIGRRDGLGLSLTTDAAVSALHAIIFPIDGQWYLRDLGSRTGTALNGKAIHQEKLEFGARIKIGEASLQFDRAPEALPDIGSGTTDADEAALSVVEEDLAPVEELDDLPAVPIPDFGLDLESPLEAPEQTVPDAADIHVESPVQPVITPPAEGLLSDADLIPLDLEETAAEQPEETVIPRRSWRSELAKESVPLEEAAVEETHADATSAEEFLPVEPAEEELTADMVEAEPVEVPAESVSESSRAEEALTAEPVDEEPSLIEESAGTALVGEAIDSIDFSPEVEPAAEHHEDAIPAAELDEEPILDADNVLKIDEFPVLPSLSEKIEPESISELSPSPAQDIAPQLPDIGILAEEVEPTTESADVKDVAKASNLEPLPIELPAEDKAEEEADLSNTPLEAISLPMPELDDQAEPALRDDDEIPLMELDESETAALPEISEDVDEIPVEAAAQRKIDASESNVASELDSLIEVLHRTRMELDESVNDISPAKIELPGHLDEIGTHDFADEIPARAETAGDEDSPAVEILEHTEPTLESALDIQPGDVTATPDASAQQTQFLLSDTTFGRAVEEFTSTSTGPIVESPTEAPAPAPSAAVEPVTHEPLKQLSDLEDLEEFVAVPEDIPVDALETIEDPELEERTLSEADLLVGDEPPHFVKVAETTVDSTEHGEPAGPVADKPLSFAEPTAEEERPVETLGAVAAVELQSEAVVPAPIEITKEEIPTFGVVAAEMPVQAISEPIEVELLPEQGVAPAEPPHIPSPAPAAIAAEPSPSARAIPPAMAPAVQPAASRSTPPIFGFNFDGASFIGGMPLRLKDPPASFGKVSYAFDSKAASFSKLSTMMPPAVPTPPPTQTPSAVAKSAPSAPPAAKRPAPPSWAPPPKRGMQPISGQTGRSLTSLASGEGGPNGPSAVPTLVDDMSVPPLARPQRAAAPSRQQLSTAFDGLGTGSQAPGADVFSQVTAPISPDSFGSGFQSPENFGDANINRSPAPQSFGAPIKLKTPPGSGGIPPTRGGGGSNNGQSRRSNARPSKMRVPSLLTLMVLLMGATWALVYLYFPHYSKVTGTLTFTNLTQQPMAEQQTLELAQIARLGSDDVRSVAKSILAAQHIPAGFLDDAIRFEEAVTKDGKVGFEGPNLQVVCQTPGQEGGPQVTALLIALAQKDADLVDTQARAKTAVDAAKFEVVKATAHRDDINSQIKVLQAAGDQRPDPTEMAKEESDAARLAKMSADAKAARVEVQLAWEALRQADTSKPMDAELDPQLVQLRKQLTDLNGQLAELGAPPATSQPAAAPIVSNNDANNDLVKQLQSQVDATRLQINQRLAAVLADQRLTPQQREANRQKAIEDLTIKLARLQSTEQDTLAAANAAAAKAHQTRQKLEEAQLASARMDELPREQTTAEADLRAKVEQQTQQQTILDSCVIPSGSPQVNVEPMPDQRPIVAGIGSGVVLMVFSYMIILATRTPGKIAAPAPISSIPAPAQELVPAEAIDSINGEPSMNNHAEQDQEPITI